MAGTSIPFLLYPTGAAPVVVSGGVRSLFAFWMGGANGTTFVPPTPPPIVPPVQAPDAGGVGRPWRNYKNTFAHYTRKLKKEQEEEYREELARLADVAERLAEQLEERNSRSEVVEVQSEIGIFQGKFEDDLARFVAEVVSRKQNADRIETQRRFAQQLIAAAEEVARIEAELQDEEDAVLTLLLH